MRTNTTTTTTGARTSKKRTRASLGLLLANFLPAVVLFCEGFQRATQQQPRHRRAADVGVFGGRAVPFATRLSNTNSVGSSFALSMSSEVNDKDRHRPTPPESTSSPEDQQSEPSSPVDDMMQTVRNAYKSLVKGSGEPTKMPPIQIDDVSLVIYDIFLMVNLTASISFWVAHRLQFQYLGTALNEGCLLSILWIVSGLYTGAFLDSAVDGHYGSADERGGPKAAGLLGLNTFINAANLRLIVALAMAVLEHRPVGSSPGEELIILEVGFGVVLMSVWRFFYSSIVPRF